MIKGYVEGFFACVPYSEAAYKAKDEIINALSQTEEAKSNSFEALISKYPSLKALAALAGYSESDVDEWTSSNELTDEAGIKKRFVKSRLNAYIIMATVVLSFASLINFTFYLTPYRLILFALFGALVFLTYKKRPAPFAGRLSLDAYAFIRDKRDKYGKKLFNSAFIGFGVCALVLFTAFLLDNNNSSRQEFFEFLIHNLAYLEVIILITGKNLIITNRANALLGDKPNKKRTHALFAASVIVSFIYWTIVLVMFKFFNTANIASAYIALGVYALMALIFNLSARRKIMYRNIRINKLRAVVIGVLLVAVGGYMFLSKDVWLTQPFINTTPNIMERSDFIAYREDSDGTGVYTITNNNEDGKFRILQLTDIHIGGSITSYTNDKKALQTCLDLINYAKPDLVVVTGDLSYPLGISSFSINNTTPVMQFSSFMRNTGVPWAFTYGNHDTEAMAASSKETLDDLYMSLSYKTGKNLLYPYSQPMDGSGNKLTGRNNQYIEIRNADGSLASVLFLIDSNAYVGKGFTKYDYIRDEQVEWYASHVEELCQEAGRTVPSYAFFHIPIEQYREAYELYLDGSDEVIYYFGENREGGKAIADICCSDIPGKLFDTALKLGSTKGFFCGHDHYNNMSLEYKGMRLTYGMSIDYLVMPGIVNKTSQRGGTLIVLDSDGEMDVSQIPYESIKTAR